MSPPTRTRTLRSPTAQPTPPHSTSVAHDLVRLPSPQVPATHSKALPASASQSVSGIGPSSMLDKHGAISPGALGEYSGCLFCCELSRLLLETFSRCKTQPNVKHKTLHLRLRWPVDSIFSELCVKRQTKLLSVSMVSNTTSLRFRFASQMLKVSGVKNVTSLSSLKSPDFSPPERHDHVTGRYRNADQVYLLVWFCSSLSMQNCDGEGP